MSPSLWFLFFLLVPTIVALQTKVVRRTAARIARVLNINAQIAALGEAPTPYEGPQRAFDMTESSISQRDEVNRREALIRGSESAIAQFLTPEIDFASFIRCISFRLFLVVFLGIDASSLTSDPKNVRLVTQALYEFYEDAEAKSALPAEMQNILERWLPASQFPDLLGRILPAYETLWRIVAATVIHCEEDGSRDCRGVMLDFRDNPKDLQYTSSYGDGESASAIIEHVVKNLPPVARTRPPTTSKSPITTGNLPASREASKTAALVASQVIDRVAGVRHRLRGESGHEGYPWDGREIVTVNVVLPPLPC
ncbi:hypothetical protein BDN67DRAFT_969372 [Paxillus ammoniavirescens]|nr:hypothetical protein BDN67DRAFT_969372 [Paxillus ammoniavirescens]